MARFGFERYMTQRKRNIVKTLLSMLEFKLMPSVTVFGHMNTYLKHFLDAFRRKGAILGDVGTEDVVLVRIFFTLFVRLIISQLFEDGLRNVSVQIVYENVF